MNLRQLGFSIIIGWLFVFVMSMIQHITHLAGLGFILSVLLLGLGLISFGYIMKAKPLITSTHRATHRITLTGEHLLQMGVVITILWVIFLLQMEGPYDLGLPKPNFVIWQTVEDDISYRTVISLGILLFLGTLVLGFILLSLGIMLKRRTERS